MKGGLGNLMKQAQEMQANMQKAQEEIASMEVTGESGGGMVKITMTGKYEAPMTRTCSRIWWLRQSTTPRTRWKRTPSSACPALPRV